MTSRNLFDLTGRTALVTGGSRGLGLQIAEALGEYGAKLRATQPDHIFADHGELPALPRMPAPDLSTAGR